MEKIDTFDLMAFAFQIANGMEHLAAAGCVHRDLALRNILIASDKTIRIADFGMAKKLGSCGYYKVKPDENIPIRWTAPDVMENLKFTEKSDIWSFAVCLYELFSLAKTPYEAVENENLIDYLNNGGSLENPEYGPKEVCKFMQKCVNLNPQNRPKFADCVKFFINKLDRFGPQIKNEMQNKLRAVKKHQKMLKAATRSIEEA